MTAWRFTRARGSVFAYGCVCVCVCTYLFYPHPRRRRRRRLTRRPPTVLVVQPLYWGEKRTKPHSEIDRSIKSIDLVLERQTRSRANDSTTRRLDDWTTTSAGQGVGVGGTNHRPRGVRARVNVSVSVERERASGVDVRAKVCVCG